VQLLAFGVEGTIRSSLTFVIPPRAIFCTPQRELLELGVGGKGARSSLTMLSKSRRMQLLTFGVEGTIRSSLTLVIPPAICCTPQRVLLEFGVVIKGARSSLTVFARPGRLLLAFGVDGNVGWRFFSVAGVLVVEGNGIFPTGESGGSRGTFPTPITVAYIIMVTEFLNNNKYFFHWECSQGGPGTGV
jgi:hypothetical protein